MTFYIYIYIYIYTKVIQCIYIYIYISSILSQNKVTQGVHFYKITDNSVALSPGDNTPRDSNYTDTCPPSQKLYKFDEPDTQDTAGEARKSS